MRQTRIVGFFLLIAITAGVATADDKPERYVEKTGGYSFVPPKDWTVREFPGLKYKIAHGPAAGGFAPNVVFVDEAFKGSLSDYVAANKKTLQALFKDYKEISETELKTVDGAPYVRLIAQRTDGGKLLRQSAFFFELAPGKKIVATCTALADGGEKFDAVFEASMKTFRPEKP